MATESTSHEQEVANVATKISEIIGCGPALAKELALLGDCDFDMILEISMKSETVSECKARLIDWRMRKMVDDTAYSVCQLSSNIQEHQRHFSSDFKRDLNYLESTQEKLLERLIQCEARQIEAAALKQCCTDAKDG